MELAKGQGEDKPIPTLEAAFAAGIITDGYNRGVSHLGHADHAFLGLFTRSTGAIRGEGDVVAAFETLSQLTNGHDYPHDCSIPVRSPA